jgi:hypothetical protein
MQGNLKKSKFSTLLNIIFFLFFFQLITTNNSVNAKTAYADFRVSVEILQQCSVNVDQSKIQNYDIIKVLLSANINMVCNHLGENSIKIINKNKQQLNNNVAFNITKNKLEPVKFTKDSLVNVFFKSSIRSDADDDLLFDRTPEVENKIEPKLLMASMITPVNRIDLDNISNFVVYLEISY